jgi:hypothetical protein
MSNYPGTGTFAVDQRKHSKLIDALRRGEFENADSVMAELEADLGEDRFQGYLSYLFRLYPRLDLQLQRLSRQPRHCAARGYRGY